MGIVILPLLLFVPEGARDHDTLQGKWKVTSLSTGSPERDKENAKYFTAIAFDGDTVRLIGQDEHEALAFKLNPAKKPREIDLYGMGGSKPEVPLLGIYSIEGDKLRLSWSKIDGKFRPTSFELAPGNKIRQVSLVLERMRKD